MLASEHLSTYFHPHMSALFIISKNLPPFPHFLPSRGTSVTRFTSLMLSHSLRFEPQGRGGVSLPRRRLYVVSLSLWFENPKWGHLFKLFDYLQPNKNQIIYNVHLLVAFYFEQQSNTTQQNESNNISGSQQLSGYNQNTDTAVASLQQKIRYGTTGLERAHAWWLHVNIA